MLNYDDARKLLSEHGQEHLLKFCNELSGAEKNELLGQIENIDFSLLDNLKAENKLTSKRGKFEPLGALTVDDIAKNSEEYLSAGIDAIRNGKVGAVLLAGGQGTRLGFDKPKGMYNIGITRELFIFECLFNNLMKNTEKAGFRIPLCIMTSEKNHDDTVNFLKEKEYFGYGSENVRFFMQDMSPCVDFNGRILMESKHRIAFSPNGSGGWFSSLARSGLLAELKNKGIEWLNVFAVDNVLQQIADPMFIGAVLSSGSKAGSKVAAKSDPQEHIGVLCLEDGKPSIVEYYEMTDEMMSLRNKNGELAYKYGVILNYLFNISTLEQMDTQHMPVHIAEKKIPYMDENGCFIKPQSPNGYKFETLVLDMVHLHGSCVSYEIVREREFAPVKNQYGIDSVDSARELLGKNGVIL